MAILKRRIDNTPAALGAELTNARLSKERQIALAEEDFKLTRDSVVERGTARIADLRALEDEARTERLLVEQVVKQA